MNYGSFVQFINKLSPTKILLLFYFLAIIFSTILLSLPIAHKKGVTIPFIDILFTAVSALSVTGLSSISIAHTLSTTGIVFLAIILQLGAVGIMAVGTFIWLLFGRHIGMRERRLIMTDQNQTTFSGMVKLVRQILYVVLLIEFVGFLVLGTYYLRYYPTASEAYFNGFFGTITAISNGGFDIVGNSLHNYSNDYFIQFVYMILIILGAIGFPVLIEVKDFLLSRRDKRKHFRFSLFTKVTTTTFFSLIAIGTLIIFVIDKGKLFINYSWHENLFYSLFQSVTTRSAGLSTLDVSLLTDSNQLFMSILMFIGASPSSAGGGIRTTTFAVVVIFIITYARGGKRIRLFRREVYDEDFLKAITVTLMAITLVLTSVIIISLFESFSIIEILFEVTSAFGTVGLSLGITSELTTLSKVILMMLMFIGRVGVITFLFTFRSDQTQDRIQYPKERIIIG